VNAIGKRVFGKLKEPIFRYVDISQTYQQSDIRGKLHHFIRSFIRGFNMPAHDLKNLTSFDGASPKKLILGIAR
jgi:hypothetical protein